MTFLNRLLSRFTSTTRDGDRLPLALTLDEASTLALAAKLMSVQAEGRRAQDAERALTEIVRILPEAVRSDTERLGEVIAYLHSPHRLGLDDPRLLTLQKAIHDRRVVRILYEGYRQEEPSPRDIEPYTLERTAGLWYLIGFDRSQQEKRTYRLSRMISISPLAEGFTPRFDTDEPVPVEVRVRFAMEALSQVRDMQHSGFRREEPALGQRERIMVYEVDRFEAILPWLLSWGAQAEVIEPQDLRTALRDEALRIVENHPS
jgi:predicted DNA-binding transcriptional regulator YafY